MKKKETDSYSTASVNSRASEQKQRKPSRFSLQRLFYHGRPPSFTNPTRSARSVRSQTEFEARSLSSLQSSHGERDGTGPSSNSSDEALTSVHRREAKKGDVLECPLCLSHQPRDHFPVIMTCHHRSCRDCLRQYLKIEITESRINIACPECAERFHPNDIQAILDDVHLMHKYEEFMLRRVLVSDPDTRWCPAPDCGFAVIATGCASCPRLKCERPGCNTHFCYHCKQHWHPNKTCDAARAERSLNMRTSLRCSNDSSSQGDIKPCPRCGAFIVKMDDGSCNHMTCAVCGSEFCWLCMKEISDLHYLSPSGCTFWGKKPWSRKKKILWQLGTLVGAPVGITLIAGIAVPAIIIGVPVYVGKKLLTKYQHSSKHRRNIIVTSGVTASIVLSPVLASVAVGIGVPILLAYVYGVVPISLCRSGGCGVTTNSGGVRFDFDDEGEEPAPGAPGPFPGGTTESAEGEHVPNVANPSIGPSIGEMSLAMTNSLSASGSHLDRVLREDSCDRDSASNRALAGASLSGSLCGSSAAAYQHRLEVQADMASGTHKRSSLSSESANFSLDAKSATVSFCDDASTKALAGSISARDCVTVQVIGPSSSGCSSSSVSAAEPVAALPSKDSPTSSRSVNFIDEVGQRAKRYKRQSLSLGDSIHEEQRLERADVVCTFKEGSSIDSADALGGCSVSMDSMRAHSAVTQVESDRPRHFNRSCSSASSDSEGVRRHCCLHGGDSCSSPNPTTPDPSSPSTTSS